MGEKKKRGRKPKNNIIVNDNPVFESSNRMNNLIIRLKTDGNNINSSLLNGYEDGKNYSEISEGGKGLHCWNCSYLINGINYGLPIKYYDQIFYTTGNFCSLNCCGRYAFDNYSGAELCDIYSNINFFLNKWCKTKNKKVTIPPKRIVLEKFGGNIGIEEYRNLENPNFMSPFPPVIPVTSDVHVHENNIVDKSNSELKLYRKKPIKNKNNIFSTMNIENEIQDTDHSNDSLDNM